MHINIDPRERAILVAIDTEEYNVETSLAELEELSHTADIDIVGHLIQNRQSPDPATFIGKGKLDELKDYIETTEADLVIFDHELSATQIRNIEKVADVPIIDRTMLILDIFAQSARTSEGRLQVELAQHRYLLPRLAGMGITMSRLAGGGAGGGGARRGKGETKLELDRRHIRRHIQNLEKELEQMEKRRDMLRERREKDNVTTVVIVGYTNVGKSTLLNALTDAGVLVENKLFATLDPTSRALELPDGRTVLLVDTVGLVRRLPHHLVEAFQSTLEEALYADLLLNVCDVSSDDAVEQIEVTRQIMKDLGVKDTPILNVLNKCDLVNEIPLIPGIHSVLISAKTGFGLTELLNVISALLPSSQKRMHLLVPYTQGGLVDDIRNSRVIFSEEFLPEGVKLDAFVDKQYFDQVEEYIL